MRPGLCALSVLRQHLREIKMRCGGVRFEQDGCAVPSDSLVDLAALASELPALRESGGNTAAYGGGFLKGGTSFRFQRNSKPG